jgi:hypothetical protein
VPAGTNVDLEGLRLPYVITMLGGTAYHAKQFDIAGVAEEAFRDAVKGG